MICAILAWGAVVAAVLALFSAFAAFLEEIDEDDYRRRGFPKGILLIFLLTSLALFWAALNCHYHPAKEQRVVVPVDRTALAEDETTATASRPAPAAAPRIAAAETALVWEYMYPLVLGERYVYSPRMTGAIAALFPARDPDGAVRAMLCGKAWVAFAGSASEEGPLDRNIRRARRRAEMVAGAASDWLDLHPDCQRPLILAINLGQHVATPVPSSDKGQSTGAQRQTLVASRNLSPGERITSEAARKELEAWLANEANFRALVGARRYLSRPVVFAPGAQG
jgi:hypothetical protein